MEWLGRAKINYTHAPSPRTIRDKDGSETDLLRICEATTPPCNLNPLLFNGHLQTLWAGTRPRGPLIHYRRRIFEAEQEEYAGTFAVDFAVPPHEEHDPGLPNRNAYLTEEELANFGSDDDKPMLVVLHGLSGGSHEVYLRHAIQPLVDDERWEVCVVTSRGCAGSKITRSRRGSCTMPEPPGTIDRRTVKWLRKTFPNRPLFGLGFSLGANILTNYCGEEGPNCPLKAAIACSNPFNLEISSQTLLSSYLGKEVYLRVMGSAMKDLVNRNRKELKQLTKLDVDVLDKITYLNEFDREVQCLAWGYPTETAYYRDASSSDAVLSIEIPFLAISATDDPIAVKEAIPYQEFKQNPNTVLVTTSLGGHLCWFEIGGSRWHTRPICNFLNHFAHKVDLNSIQPTSYSPPSLRSTAKSTYEPMRRKMTF